MIFGTHSYENVQVNKQFQLINKVKTTMKCNLHFVSNQYNLKYQDFLKHRLTGYRCGETELCSRHTRGRDTHT